MADTEASVGVAHPIRTNLSLFTGIGGLDLGVRLAVPGLRTVGYCEFDAFAASVLLARMESADLEPAPIWCGDIGAFDTSIYQGMVDLITGGPPCQPFSYAGKRKGADDARNGWPQFLRVVGDVQPAWVFAENVPGSAPYVYGEVIPRLQGMDYRIAAGLFSAAEVGAPHQRQRLFVLAHRGCTGAEQGQHRPLRWGAATAYPGEAERDVADAIGSGHDGRAPEQGRRPLQGTATPGPGEGMAEPHGARRTATGVRRSEYAGGEPQADRGAVGDADGAELAHRGRGTVTGTLPAPFPPGPEDYAAWRAVLAVRPDLAPATAEPLLRGVADGVARGLGGHRSDILRVLGNGVVPLCAAKAFVVLRSSRAL